MTTDLPTELCALAARHGLELDASTMTLHELGLDFRVGIALAASGEAWVLRVPRRSGMGPQIDAEAAILELVAAEGIVAAPSWAIRSAELVAYPALPGEPGLSIDAKGAQHWRIDPSSLRYAAQLGELLARLHAVDVERARAAGIVIEPPAEVRARWRSEVERVTSHFEVAASKRQRWEAWLAADALWPTWSSFTHGELYPAHVLVDADETITGVIDWTTAKVSDPARDFAFQRAIASPEAFAATVEAYERAGGRVWPGLGEHATELFAASPVAYGVYALQTGVEDHLAAARAALAAED